MTGNGTGGMMWTTDLSACSCSPPKRCLNSQGHGPTYHNKNARIAMRTFRTLVILLLSLVSALAPVASVAMAKPCTMTAEMKASTPSDCPCHNAMKDCGSLPQCRTAAGCASQCFTASVYLPPNTKQPVPDRDRIAIPDNDRRTSASIKPPAPPPRA